MKKLLSIMFVAVALTSVIPLTASAQIKKHKVTRKALNHTSATKEEDSIVSFNFNVNSDGNLNPKGNEEIFYIATFRGKTSSQLYNNIMINIARLYRSPETVTEKIQDKMIIVNGYAKDVTRYEYIYDGYQTSGVISLDYRLTFEFKDGKIKIECPNITEVTQFSYILGRKNKWPKSYLGEICLKDKNAKDKVEKYFNTLIANLVYGERKAEDW